MKKLLACILLLAGFHAGAQVFNNEWIDFGKTYYKFKVGADGLYRIPQPTLAAAGLGGVQAQQFQLWRNGAEVPIYTSVQTGVLGGSDYIEFWGRMNDGVPDNQLYLNPNYQLNDKWSLETDTAIYFLTVNPAGGNLRLAPTTNNVAGNVLTAETYFMHTVGNYYKNALNSGYGVNVGDYLYSSSYDRGEGWSSSNIASNGTLSFTFPNLFPYVNGPDSKFTIHVSGNATNPRRYRANLNGDSLIGRDINFLNELKDSTTFASTRLGTGAAIVVSNLGTFANDRMVVHKYEITYPRQYNFGGASNFEFVLPASGPKFLQITNFNYGNAAPVLYDLTNGKRYVGDISTPGTVKVVLEGSATDRNLVLVREESSNATTVSGLQSRTFTDYSLPANQGDYLIISNAVLFSGPNGSNPVEDYRAYRSSAVGGGYNARIYEIQDLVDQFAFGIKKHPLSVRNFLLFARRRFATAPSFAFLIGKPVAYTAARQAESSPLTETFNLVPTFGNPASDIMLSADPGTSDPKTPIGRLSVINGAEVKTYLDKVKEYELAQRTPSPFVADKAWMKNIVHAVGISEPSALAEVDGYMNSYRQIISDTLFGGKVTTFTKSSPNSVEQVNSGELDRLFAEGITLLTYFGHSSSNTLEFNLNNPDQYNNPGKYPMFIALGCNAGNFFGANRAETLSERFVLAPQRGSIGFLASSHFGITTYLDIYNQKIYQNMGVKHYGEPIGVILQHAVSDVFTFTTQADFYARVTCEESILNADPAIRINSHPKPDYVVEDQMVQLTPAFVSVSDPSFRFKAKFLNIGKAISQPITREVKRQYPDGSIQTIYKDTVPGIRYADSLDISVPIVPVRDKGTNKLTVTIDANNTVDEIFETNNSITKEVIVYEDGISPVYPYQFAIVSKQNIKFLASTANALSPVKAFRFEIDTTEKFNSPLLTSDVRTSSGGVIEFTPTITFRDSTVYYWRVGAPTPGGGFAWNTSSFIYIPSSQPGFNQSHVYQHMKSRQQNLTVDTTGAWKFNPVSNEVFVRHGTWASSTGQEAGVSVYINNVRRMSNHCINGTLIFIVIDPITFAPMANPTGGLYGSNPGCFTGRQNNFEFSFLDTSGRRKMMDFMKNAVPPGAYVIVRNFNMVGTPPDNYAPKWMDDTTYYGSNKSLYHSLKGAGFANIDSFTTIRPWIFMYKKDDLSWTPRWQMGVGTQDNITLSAIMTNPGTYGTITSPQFGPAKSWKQLQWGGSSIEPTGDIPKLSVVGLNIDGSIDTLYNNITVGQQTVDISSIDARQYPNLKLVMQNVDTLHHTPYQLKNWRVTYVPVPEGAIAPNIVYSMKDTFEVGENIQFKVAFKNVSDANFDSLRVKVVLTNSNNVADTIALPRQKALLVGDTLQIHFPIDSRQLVGMNSLFVDVNPNNDQPEQFHFNNYLYRTFYVSGDTLDPLLDVTFDNAHIVNGDIVAARPGITIKLSDNARFRLLDDTSLVDVKVRYPSGVVRSFHFNSDTMQFIPAVPGASGNEATIHFKPYFEEDGDYELIVSGHDKSNNKAGRLEYRVGFQVINKPMISNMLNYPNPFTSSTAFVFTITGSEVPQNLKIQILTITGKVVREITKQELGTLRVGRNITDFKWDGTDQYGQKLGNGVYLYRVVTNLNGKSLDKYHAAGDKTDKYFNNGYGKMYLMR
ncbi:MAG: hypothetical protein JWP27_1190 [Flaviaesturariibacter sp.]|nr:hypothetical protein [Flaviaesturariibacter sp.]